jgi:two-component system, OmpR family, response regulator
MRVLVVDDEQSVATGLRRALGAEGYEVDLARDGEEGLDLASTGRYDLIILDLMLPKRNGYQVCRAIRAAEDRTPILMLTAKAGEWDEAEGLDTGADDYLTKPFSMVVLQARVRALLRRPLGVATAAFSNGDLRLDPVGRRCWRGDHEIELTGRELSVLTVLLQRVDLIVPKDELVNRVWGDRFRGDPNIVEVYIGRLRRKLDEPFGASDIETVRGVGYRLNGRVRSGGRA